MSASDSTTRFSIRVADYVRFRPGYPGSLLECLKSELGILPGSVVADVGSGTGISTELLLRTGAKVYAVEPNTEMRHAAEHLLASQSGFESIDGRAEATGLADSSVDLVTAGQAFHWFDRAATRREFLRILKPGGDVALFWNTRLTGSSEFLRDYERLLLEFSTDYAQVDHRHVDESSIGEFFGGDFQTRHFENHQDFDFEGLKGRLLSSSYAPAAGHPNHEPMIQALKVLFDRTAQQGKVRFLYDVELYFGKLGEN